MTALGTKRTCCRSARMSAIRVPGMNGPSSDAARGLSHGIGGMKDNIP
jgi:hypothetical protein